MKKRLHPVFGFAVVILLTALSRGAAQEKPVTGSVTSKIITHHGWTNSVLLGNGSVEAVIVPAIGRVMQFRFVGDQEGPFWENRALDGKEPDAGSKDWINFGGDKTWPAPQGDWPKVTPRSWPPPPAFDSMPCDLSSFSYSGGPLFGGWKNTVVTLTSKVDPYFGIRTRRAISLDLEKPVMTIRTTYEKMEGEPVKVGVWIITQLREPVLAFLPVPAPTRFTSGYAVTSKAPPPSAVRTKALVSLTRNPQSAHKIGNDSGTLLWIGESVAVRIDSPRLPGLEYPHGGNSAEIYTNPDPLPYVELEMLGPLQTLKVGDRIQQTNTYTLFRRSESTVLAEAEKILEELTAPVTPAQTAIRPPPGNQTTRGNFPEPPSYTKPPSLIPTNATVPELLNFVQNTNFNGRSEAVRALGNLHTESEKVVPVLIASFRGQKDLFHRELQIALAKFGKAAVPDLLAALKDPAIEVRHGAASTLAENRLEPQAAVPVLLELTAYYLHPNMRGNLFEVVGRYGSQAQMAVPVLLAALNEPELATRVGKVLLQVDPKLAIDSLRWNVLAPTEVLVSRTEPTLLIALEETNKVIRLGAAWTLGQQRRQPETVIPVLMASLRTEKDSSARKSVLALAKYGSTAQPALREALKDKAGQVRRGAAEALADNRAAAEEAVPVLMELFSNWYKDPGMRKQMLVLIGKYGGEAKAAVPMLQRAAESPEFRDTALKVLKQIDPQAAAAVGTK